MRYPEGHKEAVRASIVANTARALRKGGLEGVSIPALMKRAGLTHGGFYAHFDNRDVLVAEAVIAAADETGGAVFSDDKDLEAALRLYLSQNHVEEPEHGCVVAALGGEGHHQSAIVRRAFNYAARGLIDLVDSKLRPRRSASSAESSSSKPSKPSKPSKSSRSPSDEALALTARMVGAIVLARLVEDKSLRERILAVARAA